MRGNFVTVLLGLVQVMLCFEPNITLKELMTARRLTYGPNTLEQELTEVYADNMNILPSYLIDIGDVSSTRLSLYDHEVDCRSINETILPLLTSTNLIPIFDAQEKDLWVCLPADFVPISCNPLWIELGICETALEVHRPFNQTVISVLPINDYNEPDQFPANLPLVGLCAGTYHLWLVETSRIGKIILGVTAFFIHSPSC